MIVVEDMHKHFGGFHAVDGASLEIRSGSITGLIGPNGAGKTTLFNVIAGRLPPTSGRVTMAGEDITGLPPHDLFHKGLLRTFQIVFGLSDETVSFVITHIQDRDSIDHIVDRLWKLYTETEQPDIQSVYIEVMLLMATEGGVVQEDEITQLAMTVASHADFSGMNTSQVSEAIQTALARIQADGTATRLSALSRQLVDISERTKAMGFAYSILVADGVVAPGESRCLKQMQAAFRLSEEAMKRIVSTIPAE